MKTREQVVSQLITLATFNQPQYIYSQLVARGYKSPYMPQGQVLEAELWKLYADDNASFWSVMKGLDFDVTKTNASTANNTLINLAIDQGYQVDPQAKFNLKDAWGWLVGTVAGTEQTNVSPTTTTTSSINPVAVIGLVLVAILIVVLAYFAFFKK